MSYTLRIGKPAPGFSASAVVNGEISTIELAQYKGKYVILFFYPLDFTFVCPTELNAMSDQMSEFKALDCEVLGLSVDSVYTHLAWINTPREKGGLGGNLKFPLIGDLKKDISEKYGFLSDDGDNYRAVVLVDPEGIVRHVSVTDYDVGRSVDELIRLVLAFQTVKKNGVACPANWKPGSKTMKPDPVGSMEYFSTLKRKIDDDNGNETKKAK